MAAATLLRLSYRQLKRVWRRYGQQGDAGLVHQGRGRSSNRQADPEVRERIIQRYEQRYADFGPTLAAEHLEREGLRVDHETLRRWLLAGCGPSSAADRSIASGASVKPALASWCRWMVRITTGSKAAEPKPC